MDESGRGSGRGSGERGGGGRGKDLDSTAKWNDTFASFIIPNMRFLLSPKFTPRPT